MTSCKGRTNGCPALCRPLLGPARRTPERFDEISRGHAAGLSACRDVRTSASAIRLAAVESLPLPPIGAVVNRDDVPGVPEAQAKRPRWRRSN